MARHPDSEPSPQATVLARGIEIEARMDRHLDLDLNQPPSPEGQRQSRAREEEKPRIRPEARVTTEPEGQGRKDALKVAALAPSPAAPVSAWASREASQREHREGDSPRLTPEGGDSQSEGQGRPREDALKVAGGEIGGEERGNGVDWDSQKDALMVAGVEGWGEERGGGVKGKSQKGMVFPFLRGDVGAKADATGGGKTADEGDAEKEEQASLGDEHMRMGSGEGRTLEACGASGVRTGQGQGLGPHGADRVEPAQGRSPGARGEGREGSSVPFCLDLNAPFPSEGSPSAAWTGAEGGRASDEGLARGRQGSHLSDLARSSTLPHAPPPSAIPPAESGSGDMGGQGTGPPSQDPLFVCPPPPAGHDSRAQPLASESAAPSPLGGTPPGTENMKGSEKETRTSGASLREIHSQQRARQQAQGPGGGRGKRKAASGAVSDTWEEARASARVGGESSAAPPADLGGTQSDGSSASPAPMQDGGAHEGGAPPEGPIQQGEGGPFSERGGGTSQAQPRRRGPKVTRRFRPRSPWAREMVDRLAGGDQPPPKGPPEAPPEQQGSRGHTSEGRESPPG